MSDRMFADSLSRAYLRAWGRASRVPWWPNVPLAWLALIWKPLALALAGLVLVGCALALSDSPVGRHLGGSVPPESGSGISNGSVVPSRDNTGLSVRTIRVGHGDPTTYDAPEPIVLPAAPARTIPNIIAGAAAMYGQDPAMLMRVAACESKLDPNARNPKSGASGLFQFLDGTWIANAKRVGYPDGTSPFDPGANAVVAAWMFSRGQAWQWQCA